jgi:transcriptional regulator with PAS, ATPase and Fis domain
MPIHDDPPKTETHRMAFAVGLERRPGKLTLRWLDGPQGTQHFLLTKPTNLVGRSTQADVVIDSRSISKTHFTLHLGPRGVELRDQGSTNGVWLGGCRVFHAILRVGDGFRAGDHQFELGELEDVDVVTTVGSQCGKLQGESVAMRELFARIDALSQSPLDLLILGETGTGKELTAQTLHQLSSRRSGPFVTLDCGTLTASLAEATLFGVRKGAYTGADRDTIGVFEEAHGGTIFLDEIGELPLDLQVKLLRVLERREVMRVGEPAKPRTLDIRVVSATHRDLRREVAEGRFREDLFYRLGRGMLEVPPLRERGEDILRLAERFLSRLRNDHGLDVQLGADARDALLRHAWPGNVRELRNCIEQAAYLRRVGEIRACDLRLDPTGIARRSPLDLVNPSDSYADAHLAFDRVFLHRVLSELDGNISAASRRLGLSRDTLRARMKAARLGS